MFSFFSTLLHENGNANDVLMIDLEKKEIAQGIEGLTGPVLLR